MSQYSKVKRLLHFLVGGSAIWLGSTFCSLLAANDLDLPPIPASAPDALAAPQQTTRPSIVPPTSLLTDEPGNWDNGPVLDDLFYEVDGTSERESCDEYVYDGYEVETASNGQSAAVESARVDGLVDMPDRWVYSDLEAGYEDFSNVDDQMCVHDLEQQGDDSSGEAEEVSESESGCGYEEEWAADSEDVCGVRREEDISPGSEGYHGDFSYDDEEKYTWDYGDCEDAYEAEAVGNESADQCFESGNPVDPEQHYGHAYEGSSEWMEIGAEDVVEIDLFSWQPTELLRDADLDLIRSLGRLSGESGVLRPARLNEYIEALGFEGIDFAYRYEDGTDTDVLALANDLPSVAAFLASYRLVEQDKLGMDEAVVLLEGALSELSLEWIQSVGRIAAATEPVVSASHPVVDAMAAAATHTILGLNALASRVSQQLSSLPWMELSARFQEVRLAFRPLGSKQGRAF